MRELHLEERPISLKQVVGQNDACRQLVALAKSDEGIPHCLLFTGPSGCGKTTLARITRDRLHCGDADFAEVNAADSRGIDMVRSIASRVGLAPISGDVRVWLIDECHALTGDAQGAFLKLLEEPPDHVYFMLATTNPTKLRRTIRTRCTEIAVKAISEPELAKLVARVAGDRGVTLTSAVAAKLAEVAEGSARKALVLLQQVMGIADEANQLAVLERADAKQAAIELARAILARKGWPAVAAILRNCDEEPESIRWMMLSYFTKVALGGRGNDAAVAVMEEFQDNFYDSKKAGLVIACYRACKG